MPLKSVSIRICGRVQGVGFRYFAKLKADELEISGWVKNLPGEKVEIEAQGESDNLITFTDWMKIGPARAIVKTFSATEIPISNFQAFYIRYK